MIDQLSLKQLLHYDEDTGLFHWIKTNTNCVFVGTVAGSNGGKGYLQIQINGKCYKAHRLAWLYVYGEMPSSQIDHVNGIRNDNRINNLRLATSFQNIQNQKKAQKHNKTGFLGVTKKNGKYVARIGINNQRKWLGYYDTPELAHAVYLDEKRKLHEFCTI